MRTTLTTIFISKSRKYITPHISYPGSQKHKERRRRRRRKREEREVSLVSCMSCQPHFHDWLMLITFLYSSNQFCVCLYVLLTNKRYRTSCRPIRLLIQICHHSIICKSHPLSANMALSTSFVESYLFGVIVRVRVVFRKTVVSD